MKNWFRAYVVLRHPILITRRFMFGLDRKGNCWHWFPLWFSFEKQRSFIWGAFHVTWYRP